MADVTGAAALRNGGGHQREQEKNDHPSPTQEAVDGMTLQTINNVVWQPPGPQPLMNVPTVATNAQRPDNYVVKPEALGDEPDYVDCPWCYSRQKTRVEERSSNTTRYVRRTRTNDD